MTLRHFILGMFIALTFQQALAHEGGHHVKGVVKQASAERLILAEPGGRDVTFKVTPETEFYREKRAVKWSDLKPGERAVVHTDETGQAAQVVFLGVAPK